MGPKNPTVNYCRTVGYRRRIWHFRISQATLQ
nr:MAG TPA: hypothetical protein [Caudoviricetes sp.]